jgi:hypothetical protein
LISLHPYIKSNKVVYLLRKEKQAVNSVDEIHDIIIEKGNVGNYIGHGDIDASFDVSMGGVGFIGLPGAIASGLFFVTKPLQKLNAEYINKAQSGMSDLGKGYHAIQLALFK